jgi:hypothetical protein
LDLGAPRSNTTPAQQLEIRKQSFKYFIRNHQLYRRNQKQPSQPLLVIKTTEVETLIHNIHNEPLGGHLGRDITYNKIASKYYWPNMYRVIDQWVKTCDICQRQGRPKRMEPLHPIPVGHPFDRVGIDYVGPLPRTTKGNRYIIVATEYLTKWVEATATPDCTSQTTAQFIYSEIICRHGAPKEILTDRATSFQNELINALFHIVGTKHRLSSPYHPQTNGLTERFNRTLCNILAKYAEQHKGEWDSYLSSALFAYRTAQQGTTKLEPFELLYGRKATLPIDLQLKRPSPESNLPQAVHKHHQLISNQLEQRRSDAQQNILQRQQQQQERYNKSHPGMNYQIGDKVLMFNVPQSHVHGDKFKDKFDGPFYIHDIVRPGTYKLRALDGRVRKNPIHADLLKPYLERSEWTPQIIIS